ncbi:MAG: hypothetical protein EAS51_09280 [Microbacteriaceae bacterium]|nr:MAG: hypothetical protein EAS51_09280 [Microbacteriaceae bacterium]
MAAVIVPDTHREGLAAAVAKIKEEFSIPPRVALHWSDHCKTFPRRQYVANVLAGVDGVKLNYVVFEKAAIPQKATILTDGVRFYNYTAGIALERILLTAAAFPGEDRRVQVQYGHVRGFDHEKTLEYLWKKRGQKSLVDWSLLVGDPTFVDASRNSGLQAADQYAGMLRSAICPDKHGGYEEAHFLRVAHQMRRHPETGRAWGYGLKVMARDDAFQSLPWWTGKK